MRNYFPKRTLGAPLLTLSKLYDVPVGFVPPLLSQCIAIFAVAEGLLLSISNDLSCSYKNLVQLDLVKCLKTSPISGLQNTIQGTDNEAIFTNILYCTNSINFKHAKF